MLCPYSARPRAAKGIELRNTLLQLAQGVKVNKLQHCGIKRKPSNPRQFLNIIPKNDLLSGSVKWSCVKVAVLEFGVT